MNKLKVTVAGAGILGAQIATQIAYKGYDVCVYEVEEALDRAHDLLGQFRDAYARKFTTKRANPQMHWRGIFDKVDVTAEEIDEAEAQFNEGMERLHVTTSPEEAFSDPDYVIEAISEKEEAKIAFYSMIAPLLPEKTLLLTNTSTLLPSTFAPYTGCPERYLAMHFMNCIWSCNQVEVMAHPAGDGFPATDSEAVEKTVAFAKSIGMEPFLLKKEYPQYVYNTIFTRVIEAALELLVEGVADVETIDALWSMHGSPRTGPFRSMDSVGLYTVYNCTVENPDVWVPGTSAYKQRELLESMIAEGNLGYNVGKGFYEYDIRR